MVYGDGAVWVTTPGANVLTRVDAKTNKVTDSITTGAGPRFETFGGGAIWTLNQGDGTISRVDVKSRKVVATIEAGLTGTGGEIAFGLGHVWATLFQIPITEIDPASNTVVHQWVGDGGDSIRAGHSRSGFPICVRIQCGASIRGSFNDANLEKVVKVRGGAVTAARAPVPALFLPPSA